MSTLTAEELAKEIARAHDDVRSAGDIPTFADLANALLPFIQSIAAGVQGAGDKPFAHAVFDRIGSLVNFSRYTENGQYVFSAAHIAALDRNHPNGAPHYGRLLFDRADQPPRDAGAVPLPEPTRFTLVGAVNRVVAFTSEQLASYGAAREAAAANTHERDILKVIDERDHLESIIDRILDAVLGSDRPEWSSVYDYKDAVLAVEEREAAGRADAVLYEVANNLMLLVEGPGSLRWEDGEGFRLKDTSEWARFYVEVKNAKERTIPQHPPAEPADSLFIVAVKKLVIAARTSGGTAGRDDGLCAALDAVEAMLAEPAARAQVVGYRWRNSDHQPWTLGETVSGFDLNSREIGAAIEPLGVVTSAHPSPAHAGAGDAEAVDESALMKYARSRGWPVTLSKSVPVGDGTWYHNWDITIPTHELAKFFPARRLAGGKAENPQKCGASVDDIRGRRYCILSWSHAGPHFAPVGGDHA